MTYEAVYDNDNPRSPSGGWIQWKGTDVCMDLHCQCGWDGHVDGDFIYAIECPQCHTKYAVGCNIKLIPLDTPEKLAHIQKHNTFVQPE